FLIMPPLLSPLFPYTTLFRSGLPTLASGIAMALLKKSGAKETGQEKQQEKHQEKGNGSDTPPELSREQELSALRDMLLIRRFEEDRKSTRLNSSHDQISYAVF